MQIRLLIFGAFVHSIFLLWSYDIYGKTEHSDISCPLLSSYNTEAPRRVIFAVLRSTNQIGPINGIGNEFFRKIPNVIYVGGSAIPEYYEGSADWYKITYQENWNNFNEEFQFVFNSLRENDVDLTRKISLYFLIFQGRNNKRNLLFIMDQLEKERKFLNEQYHDNSTSVLLFTEDNRVIISSGYKVKHYESQLIRSADVTPLISTLLGVDMPYNSFALVPINYFESTKDIALAEYCNALNIIDLTEDIRHNTRILKYIQKLPLENNLFTLKSAIEQMYLAKNYTGSMILTENLIASYISAYIYAKQVVNIVTFISIALSTLCWVTILCFEYIQTSAAIIVTESKRCLIHFIFFLLSLSLISIPFSQGWPYTYHFYFQLPILLIWLITIKLQNLLVLKIELEHLNQLLIFTFAIFFSVEYLLIEDNLILSLSICLIALFPCLKKFRTAPFVFVFAWYILSTILLGSVYLNKLNGIEPNTKYINLSGTIWLLLSGIALLWVQSKFDKILIAILTACIGSSMWLQNICLTLKNHCNILIYCTWPFISLIVFPIFTKTDAITKLVHCILSLIVPVMLTSTKLEPIALLVLLCYVASWSAIETYNTKSSVDNLRRMLMLIYLLFLTDQLTATDQISFKCFICQTTKNTPLYIFLLKLLRLTFIYASILITFRIAIRSKHQAYCSAVLVAIVLAVASFRVLIPLITFSFETNEFYKLLNRYIRINSMATVFIVSYAIMMIYAPNEKHDATPSPPFEQSST
ncbi:hypothetical protein O3M35_002031 [Rhynocoris fuscipes]|uniref:GPI ethanolamine phosphate transferase 1 n=1 Tax=Rhynocoris fuscipes TaxID=488301 RepID=A0AAW1CT94_9HEMI